MGNFVLGFVIVISLIFLLINLIMLTKFRRIIFEKERTNRKLQRLAHTDDLTGLYNYRFLVNHLQKEMAKAEKDKRPITILMLDIDHFKKYNDTHGHPKGDKILYEISQVIKINAREADKVTRYGGEEFCVILKNTNVKVAVELAEKIRRAIEKHPFHNREGQTGGILTVSIGVAGYPEHADYGDDLIMMADQALYRAKSKRNKVEVYDQNFDNTMKVAGLYE